MSRTRALSLLLGLFLGCGDDGGGGEPDAGPAACADDDECSDGVFCNGAERCDPGAPGANALGCLPPPGDPCMVGRTCDESADACVTECDVSPDADGDGVDSEDCGGTDCDDGNDDRFPGNTEVCDGVGLDEDCDPSTFGSRDADSDGFVSLACCNGDACGPDCDDSRGQTFPDAAETCNGIDDDCDGSVDEELPVQSFRPDCDNDGFAPDDASAVDGCAAPTVATPCPGGAWVTMTGDCDDAAPGVNPGNPEVCNGVDDDCDELVDDIDDGVVICESGQSGIACVNACGVAGTATCAADCLGPGTCSSSMSEICNYCDDDGDGVEDDRALASGSSTGTVIDCNAMGTFGAASCRVDDIGSPGGDIELTAILLDGSTNDSAGAAWFSPAALVAGYGVTEIEIVLRVRAAPTGMGVEQPQGGWAVVVAHGGTPGVGTPEAVGVPIGLDGLGAVWRWDSRFCTDMSGQPRGSEDGVIVRSFGPGQRDLRDQTISEFDFGCAESTRLAGSASDFDGNETGWVEQRMRIRYTPDQPDTGPSEERIALRAGGETFVYAGSDPWMSRPSGEIPIGASLMVGLTAGTFTENPSLVPGVTFGVPVEAEVTLVRIDGPTTTPLGASFATAGVCP